MVLWRREGQSARNCASIARPRLQRNVGALDTVSWLMEENLFTDDIEACLTSSEAVDDEHDWSSFLSPLLLEPFRHTAIEND